MKRLFTPLKDEDILELRAGDGVTITGTIYVARDAAHKRLMKSIENRETLPFDFSGQVIYYAGPCPAPPNCIVGSCGPTTSGRMDPYTPTLLNIGLKGTIGKGYRSQKVKEAIIKNKAIYLIATGGAGALIAKKVKKANIVAYADLGPEAIWKFYVEEIPLIVGIDVLGNDVYNLNW